VLDSLSSLTKQPKTAAARGSTSVRKPPARAAHKTKSKKVAQAGAIAA
jgi:hypothetical protein